MAEPRITVLVIYSPRAREVREWPVQLPVRATTSDAIEASGFHAEYPQADTSETSIGVWGRKVPGAHALRDADRVEIYRPLLVDPKLARRERFRKQGSRAAGLFARQRAGAKPGY
ncbi:MAG: RnfH family protein [Pseudomonadota bacterium]